MQEANVGRRQSQAPLVAAQCEVLFELFQGSVGAVQLGRLLKGNDAGRLVALRRLKDKPSSELASATDLARSIAHPKLAKVLGVVRDREGWYVASEYLPGVSLFELARTVVSRGVPLDTAVSVRIVLDALEAAHAARRLLMDTAQIEGVRCIHAESIWIADFGETFVAELGVAPLLGMSQEPGSDPSPDDRQAEDADVYAAASELARLASTKSDAEKASDPRRLELHKILNAILERRESRPLHTLEQFIAALSGLGPDLIASEEQVCRELERVMGGTLERRTQKLETMERGLGQPAEVDATRVFAVGMALGLKDSLRPHDDPTAIFSIPPASEKTPTAKPLQMDFDMAQPSSPISAVWREARAVLDSPHRRTRMNSVSELSSSTTQVAVLRSMRAPSAVPTPARRLTSTRNVMLFLVLALVTGAVCHQFWSRGASFASKVEQSLRGS